MKFFAKRVEKPFNVKRSFLNSEKPVALRHANDKPALYDDYLCPAFSGAAYVGAGFFALNNPSLMTGGIALATTFMLVSEYKRHARDVYNNPQLLSKKATSFVAAAVVSAGVCAAVVSDRLDFAKEHNSSATPSTEYNLAQQP